MAQADLIQIGSLPQIVPSRTCFSCEVCCRFPEADSFLRPYFTREETARAIAAGVDPSCFPSPDGGQVRLVPRPGGEGHVCPAFDLQSSRCGIYDARPLDCQLYPLAVMWSEDGRRVLLGWDQKCPFLRDGGPREGEGLQEYAARVAERLEREETLQTLVDHPRLIGPFQDDVVVLRTLARVTARLTGSGGAPAVPAPRARTLEREPITLSPLTSEDRARVERALAAAGWAATTSLAAYAFAPHMIWRSLLRLSWAELAGHLCLFAECADGLFMLLPPLGPGPLAAPLREAFLTMRRRNGGSAVTRVENVPEELRAELEGSGYRLRPKDPDYLYRCEELARLAGDRYKSQRAACNRIARAGEAAVRPYRREDREACLALFELWAAQKAERGLEAVAACMLADARAAHREALLEGEALGLVGRVLWVRNALAGYTFGYPRTGDTFCVLLEIADRSLPGAAQFLFREVAREALERGCAFVNTMDASGLGSLRASKEQYHPLRLLPNYIATES